MSAAAASKLSLAAEKTKQMENKKNLKALQQQQQH
jgi:hypothetical protein